MKKFSFSWGVLTISIEADDLTQARRVVADVLDLRVPLEVILSYTPAQLEVAQAAFDNAIEVASAYWINEVTDLDKDGYSITVERNEAWKNNSKAQDWHAVSCQFSYHGKVYSITPETLAECRQAFLERYPHFAGYYPGDTYEGDAESDDSWFQFAAFGDTMFS